jgi:hypothetical protein
MITTRDVPALTSAACRRSSALTHRDYADPLVLLVGRGRSGPAGPKGSCSPPCPPSCGSGWDILSCSTSPVCDSSGLRFLASMGDSELIMIGHDATSSGLDARLLTAPVGRCAPYRVVAGVPNPGTVMVLRVVATTAPRTSATVNTARISTMTTRLWRAGARCAGGRRGHSCGRGAGPRSRRRWRCTPDGSGIVGRRYSCVGQVVGRTRRQTRLGSGPRALFTGFQCARPERGARLRPPDPPSPGPARGDLVRWASLAVRRWTAVWTAESAEMADG